LGRDCAVAQPPHGLSRRKAFLQPALLARIRRRMSMIAGFGTGCNFQMFDSRGRFPGAVGRFSGRGQKAPAAVAIRGCWLTQRFPDGCEQQPSSVSSSNGNRRDAILKMRAMAYSSLVQCEKCGYENFPQHRFCGMCGAGLRLPGAVGARPIAGQKPSSARQEATRPVSGPSFLGLGDERLGDERGQRKGASYLLVEDDRASRHRGRYLALILLIAAIVVAAWHRREGLAGLAAMWSDGQPSSISKAAPAMPVNGDTQADQPRTGDLTTTTQPLTSSAPTSQSSSADVASAGVIPADGSVPALAQSSQANRSEGQAPAGLGESLGMQPTTATTEPTSKGASPQPAFGRMETEGEKYLYGAGVPQNCAQAQSSLLTAAQHSDAKAQSVLGTMYATGHCVSRDLPLAYLWFSRASHLDPRDERIEQDLRVVWSQMTADERQLALHSGP